MSLLDNKTSKIRISEVIKGLGPRDLPVVPENASIEDVISAIVDCRHSRMLNVVNDRKELVGTVSLSALTRHVFDQDYEPTIHARSLIGLLSRETAGDIMRKQPICATAEEEIGVVTRRMLAANVKEIPVVDSHKRVITDITIVDLIQHLLALKEGDLL
ncbi:CBS domain-containing protein [Gimesia fumaroli]|uniref:Putative voltage-gated ClC-type chloride channel ClcB n=1 Tax=Gimesia fumaroli TaxID=2527976 RepID=A0A518I5N9_9PLAN|nr:CBS domain-containing protein [Gimesia fumaroli]QDV48368.1 putative voltage-gated ClC-type chloride channel ClcB [Gimesia fumaroli]